MKLLLAAAFFVALPCTASDTDPGTACFNEMWTKPDARAAALKMNPTEPGDEAKMRVSNARLSAKEKAAVGVLLEESLRCQRLAEPGLSTLPPEGQVMMRELGLDMNGLFTRLYAGRATWADFFAERDRIFAGHRNKMAEYNARADVHNAQLTERLQEAATRQAEEVRKARIREDFERQQRADASQRQVEQMRQLDAQRNITNGLMLLDAARPRYQAEPMQMPSFGTSCTSNAWGGTVYTNCR